MSKPFSLQPVLELMQTRTDDATQELGRLVSAEQDAKNRLSMLQQYRSEYTDRLQQAAERGISQQEWQNFQAFIAKLDEAIGQQSQIVAESGRQTAAGQAHWLEQRNRLKAMHSLSDRHAEAERYRDGKQEQKLSDEFSARRRFPD